MADVPTESPHKYGRMESDDAELDAVLSGRDPKSLPHRSSRFNVPDVPVSDEITTADLGAFGNPRNKYGDG